MPKLTLTEETKKILADNPEFTAKWVAGLRSGKYKQTRDQMCNPRRKNSACCLHVMEIECNNRQWEDGLGSYYPSEFDNALMIGDKYPQQFNAQEETGKKYSPSTWNDELHLSFTQIADLLEHGEVEYV